MSGDYCKRGAITCYDEAMGSLKEAIAQGSMVLKEKNVPLAMEGVVKASGQWGGSSLWVLLDNGDRWSIQPSKARRDPPPPGTAVKLTKTFMGTYWTRRSETAPRPKRNS